MESDPLNTAAAPAVAADVDAVFAHHARWCYLHSATWAGVFSAVALTALPWRKPLVATWYGDVLPLGAIAVGLRYLRHTPAAPSIPGRMPPAVARAAIVHGVAAAAGLAAGPYAQRALVVLPLAPDLARSGAMIAAGALSGAVVATFVRPPRSLLPRWAAWSTPLLSLAGALAGWGVAVADTRRRMASGNGRAALMSEIARQEALHAVRSAGPWVAIYCALIATADSWRMRRDYESGSNDPAGHVLTLPLTGATALLQVAHALLSASGRGLRAAVALLRRRGAPTTAPAAPLALATDGTT